MSELSSPGINQPSRLHPSRSIQFGHQTHRETGRFVQYLDRSTRLCKVPHPGPIADSIRPSRFRYLSKSAAGRFEKMLIFSGAGGNGRSDSERPGLRSPIPADGPDSSCQDPSFRCLPIGNYCELSREPHSMSG
jgi:hypothetical protein